jgi:hypothetical protein
MAGFLDRFWQLGRFLGHITRHFGLLLPALFLFLSVICIMHIMCICNYYKRHSQSVPIHCY